MTKEILLILAFSTSSQSVVLNYCYLEENKQAGKLTRTPDLKQQQQQQQQTKRTKQSKQYNQQQK